VGRSHKNGPKSQRAKGFSAASCKDGWQNWLRSKSPVLVFVAAFGLLLGLFYGVTLTPLFKNALFPAYLRFNAAASNVLLRVVGQDSVVRGTSISSRSFSIDIRRGCDAVEPTALLLAAVLAFPVPFRRKIPGLLLGSLLLALVNLVRIASLFLIGIYFPRTFELMHGDVWQVVFILLAILFWVLWMRWATRPGSPAPQA
jgi:exosortase H (IPTLxxWG-CTERM-specific)